MAEEPKIVAAVASMTSHATIGTPLSDQIQDAMQAAVRDALAEGLSVEKDVDEIRARQLAARDRVLQEHGEA